MKKGFVAATLLAVILGMGGLFVSSSMALAAGEETPASKCDQIADEAEKAKCLADEAHK